MPRTENAADIQGLERFDGDFVVLKVDDDRALAVGAHDSRDDADHQAQLDADCTGGLYAVVERSRLE